MKKRVLSVFMLLGLVLSGCATVEPWQKGNLADETMQSGRDDLAGVMKLSLIHI